jgi:hypothetical protein
MKLLSAVPHTKEAAASPVQFCAKQIKDSWLRNPGRKMLVIAGTFLLFPVTGHCNLSCCFLVTRNAIRFFPGFVCKESQVVKWLSLEYGPLRQAG